MDKLLYEALRAKDNKSSQEQLRAALERFYEGLDVDLFKQRIPYEQFRGLLRLPHAYKIDLLSYRDDVSFLLRIATFGDRKLGLLRDKNIRFDLIVLREGGQIPPHMHSGTVSGFYVVEGSVAVRHYDQCEDKDTTVVIRKTVDRRLNTGDFTTNSEFQDNIHWLCGLKGEAILFRFNTTQLAARFRVDHSNPRVYVDPSRGSGADDCHYEAPKITEEEAKALGF